MKKHMLLLFAFILLLTGCWDRIDIENRGYVLGIAIDSYPPNPIGTGSHDSEASPEEELPLGKTELHTGKPEYAMTVQFPILYKAQSANFYAGGGDSESKATWQITQIGNSFMSMNQEMATRINLTPYYEHLQVIIISEDIAKDGILKVLDFFVRDPEMRRRVNIYVSQGEAKKILDVVPRIEDYSSIYLAQIPLNKMKTSRMVEITALGELMDNLDLGLDFILPAVQSTKDEIKSSGAVAFKDDQMVGLISELELEAVRFILNRYHGGILAVTDPATEDGIFVLEVRKSRTKIKTSIENNQPRFDIDIKVFGSYAENLKVNTHGEHNAQLHKKLEREFEKEIIRLCNRTVKKMQQEYGVDIFRFKHLLMTREPRYWKQIKDKWDDIYPKAIININADVKINLIGITS